MNRSLSGLRNCATTPLSVPAPASRAFCGEGHARLDSPLGAASGCFSCRCSWRPAARMNIHTATSMLRPLPCFRNCENVISIAAVEEINYRQSRLCRLLGNPIAFTVVWLLAERPVRSSLELVASEDIGRAFHRKVSVCSGRAKGARNLLLSD